MPAGRCVLRKIATGLLTVGRGREIGELFVLVFRSFAIVLNPLRHIGIRRSSELIPSMGRACGILGAIISATFPGSNSTRDNLQAKSHTLICNGSILVRSLTSAAAEQVYKSMPQYTSHLAKALDWLIGMRDVVLFDNLFLLRIQLFLRNRTNALASTRCCGTPQGGVSTT